MSEADAGTWINAGASILIAFVVATLLDRAFRGRAARLATEKISREGATRLRFVRRLLYAVILLIGIAIALSGFTGISQLATSLLASGAIAAAIIGFAARQTLANFIAGLMLATTQPIRVGDWVTFEDNYGVVEDVSLNHTILRTPSEQRIVIPNEKLAGGILKNDTLKVDLVARSKRCTMRRARRSASPRSSRGARDWRWEAIPSVRRKRLEPRRPCAGNA